MWMVFTHGIAHDTGAFAVRRVRGDAQFVHGKEDAALHGLLAVRDFRERAALHHRHRVFEIGLRSVAREREGAVFLGLPFGRGAYRNLFSFGRLQLLL